MEESVGQGSPKSVRTAKFCFSISGPRRAEVLVNAKEHLFGFFVDQLLLIGRKYLVYGPGDRRPNGGRSPVRCDQIDIYWKSTFRLGSDGSTAGLTNYSGELSTSAELTERKLVVWKTCTKCSKNVISDKFEPCPRCGQPLVESSSIKSRKQLFLNFIQFVFVWIFIIGIVILVLYFLMTAQGGNPFTRR